MIDAAQSTQSDGVVRGEGWMMFEIYEFVEKYCRDMYFFVEACRCAAFFLYIEQQKKTIACDVR